MEVVLCAIFAVQGVPRRDVAVLGVDVPARPLPAFFTRTAGVQHSLPHEGEGFLNMAERRKPSGWPSADVFDPPNLAKTTPNEAFEGCERSGDGLF